MTIIIFNTILLGNERTLLSFNFFFFVNPNERLNSFKCEHLGIQTFSKFH
jgi:hypothetical protein